MEWKAKGYVFKHHKNDHPPWHIHISKDGRELGRYDLENGRFMEWRGRRTRVVLAAMRQVGLLGEAEGGWEEQ